MRLQDGESEEETDDETAEDSYGPGLGQGWRCAMFWYVDESSLAGGDWNMNVLFSHIFRIII